jgi:hypothetical protein
MLIAIKLSVSILGVLIISVIILSVYILGVAECHFTACP